MDNSAAFAEAERVVRTALLPSHVPRDGEFPRVSAHWAIWFRAQRPEVRDLVRQAFRTSYGFDLDEPAEGAA